MGQYLNATQMASLAEAIQLAEESSTGEIRLHIDQHQYEGNMAQRALEVFKNLEMENTLHRNAVLFHVHFEKKYLTIIGDKGIHEKVKQRFWDQLHDQITQGFAEGKYYEALREGILETGKELKKFFPHHGNNPNELSNEVTIS